MTPEEIIGTVSRIFEAIGFITTIMAIIGGLVTIVGWIAGVSMVMKRLGLGRWYRKVLIVSGGESGEMLKKDLIDSGVFRGKNISIIGGQSLSDIKTADLILLDYWSIDPNRVLTAIGNKQNRAGMVVYSPMKNGRITPEVTERINDEPFTTIVQMRGRLVNDLLITLMSTSYYKKRR